MKAVGYLRVSTDEQARSGLGLEAQREKIEAYARLYDVELVAVLVDEGKSAKDTKREGLQMALAMLKRGEAGGLLVAKLDRLTRSVRDLGDLLDEYFSEGAAALLSVAEQVDTRTAGGRLVLNVLGAVSQWERETIAERTRDALAMIQKSGRVLGSDGLGFKLVDGKRVPVKSEEATVARIKELRDTGASLRAIAHKLMIEGHKTKRGGVWAAATVAAVLNRINGDTRPGRHKGLKSKHKGVKISAGRGTVTISQHEVDA